YDLIFYLAHPSHNQHTFPTRRSTDLRLVPHTQPTGASHRVFHHIKRGRAQTDHSANCPTLGEAMLLYRTLAQRPSSRSLPPYHPDRKSTRLNSSHVKISYAVFCLKKK